MDAVKAATPSRPIKAVGGCASMSPAGATAGTLLHTYNLNQIRVFDESKRLFWLGTGVSISDTVHYLASRSPKLAMPNLGGWTGQTVVGAVTTGTHGSGINYPPLCDFVHAVHIVAGDGAQYIFEPSTGAKLNANDYPGVTLVQDDAQFRASVVTVGTLGVVVAMLYEAVPYFWVAQKRYIKPWAEIKGRLTSIISENDHVELWINPYDGSVLVSERNRKTANEFIKSAGDKVAVANKKDEFRTVRGFRTGWESGMTVAAAAIQTARDADIAGCPGSTAACACHVAYRAANNGKDPPAAFPHANSCVSALLKSALEGEAEYSNVVADYPYMYDTGRANSATVLCSEPSVPIADADSMIDEYFSYANSLASGSDSTGSGRNFYTAFASARFSGESQHLMASSFGGLRAYIEAPAVQGLGYQPNERSADQVQLIDGLNLHLMQKIPQARLHFGLQNDVGWDAAVIQQRYPAYSWRMFTSMEARYDPHDVTRSEYEDRILGKGKYATLTITGTGCVRDGECVTSKNYPKDYGNREECTIRGFEGKAIGFESFDVESHNKCDYDALIINGNPHCGSVKPVVVPTAPIEWKTDGSVVRGGWKMCPSLIIIEGTGCVRDGECVTSKNYPSSYGNDEKCKIRGFEGRQVQFERFDVESHGACAYDALTINGDKKCGSTKPVAVATTPIEWKTDGSVVKGGWKMCPGASTVTRSGSFYPSATGAVVALALAGLCIPIYRRRRSFAEAYRRKSSVVTDTRTMAGVEATRVESELERLSRREPSDDVEAPAGGSEVEPELERLSKRTSSDRVGAEPRADRSSSLVSDSI